VLIYYIRSAAWSIAFRPTITSCIDLCHGLITTRPRVSCWKMAVCYLSDHLTKHNLKGAWFCNKTAQTIAKLPKKLQSVSSIVLNSSIANSQCHSHGTSIGAWRNCLSGCSYDYELRQCNRDSQIQLVEIILFSLRQTATVVKTTEVDASIVSNVATALDVPKKWGGDACN